MRSKLRASAHLLACSICTPGEEKETSATQAISHWTVTFGPIYYENFQQKSLSCIFLPMEIRLFFFNPRQHLERKFKSKHTSYQIFNKRVSLNWSQMVMIAAREIQSCKSLRSVLQTNSQSACSSYLRVYEIGILPNSYWTEKSSKRIISLVG